MSRVTISDIIGHHGVFVLGTGGVEHSREVVERLERHFADLARKSFVTMRRLEGKGIRAAFAQRAEREAERFLGFGHSAEDAEQHHLKGEALALKVDFEVLKGLAGLHDLRLSDLDGVSPEDWYVKRFTARWLADVVVDRPAHDIATAVSEDLA